MKLFVLPLIFLLLSISSAAFSVTADTAISADPKLTVQQTRPAVEHCDSHDMPTLTKMSHAISTTSMPLDCEDGTKCCAQSCYSQIQLYLHSLSDNTRIHYSYLPQQHSFSLVQGAIGSIERPPKL